MSETALVLLPLVMVVLPRQLLLQRHHFCVDVASAKILLLHLGASLDWADLAKFRVRDFETVVVLGASYQGWCFVQEAIRCLAGERPFR